MKYSYIIATILFTVYGQLILKSRIVLHGDVPIVFKEKLLYIIKLYLDPWIVSGFLAAFLAAVFWTLALSRFEISFAYPFMGLTYIFVFAGAVLFFGETFSVNKLIGTAFVIVGIYFMSR